MKSRSRAAKWAVATTLAMLAIGSSLPIWSIRGQYTPEKRAKGMTKPFYRELPLWMALAHLPEEVTDNGPYVWQNLIVSGALVALVGVTGWGTFRLLTPRVRQDAARDYAEGRRGAVMDGRGEPHL